jgi:hypothetical protein
MSMTYKNSQSDLACRDSRKCRIEPARGERTRTIVYTVCCNLFKRQALSLTDCHSNSDLIGKCLQHVLKRILGSDRHNWMMVMRIHLLYGSTSQMGFRPPHCWGFDITLRHTTLGCTPLNERSAHCRELYLTKHNVHNRKISLLQAGFEPSVPAGERLKTATGIDQDIFYQNHNLPPISSDFAAKTGSQRNLTHFM